MDILDTSGDWLELFFAIIFFIILTVAVSAVQSRNNIPPLAGAAVISLLLWTQVYDYDWIIGYLIGSVIVVLYSGKIITQNNHKSHTQEPFMGPVLIGLSVGLVMIIKILFYFK